MEYVERLHGDQACACARHFYDSNGIFLFLLFWWSTEFTCVFCQRKWPSGHVSRRKTNVSGNLWHLRKSKHGLLIMKDLMRLNRDAHYWYTGGKHFLLRTQFGGVMSHDRFFQIWRYLYLLTPVDRTMQVTNFTRSATFWTNWEQVSWRNLCGTKMWQWTKPWYLLKVA